MTKMLILVVLVVVEVGIFFVVKVGSGSDGDDDDGWHLVEVVAIMLMIGFMVVDVAIKS